MLMLGLSHRVTETPREIARTIEEIIESLRVAGMFKRANTSVLANQIVLAGADARAAFMRITTLLKVLQSIEGDDQDDDEQS